MAISRDATKATRFIAVATVETASGTQKETAAFDPTATIAEVYAAFFEGNHGLGRFGSTVSTIEILPDTLTVPPRSGLFDREVEKGGTDGSDGAGSDDPIPF